MGLFTRSQKPRGIRPELPTPLPGLIGEFDQWGAQPLSFVTEGQVRGLPAMFRCINLIANGVASMSPLELFGPDGVTKLATPAVLARPLATMQTFDYWHAVVACAMTSGEFVGLHADYDQSGYPQQVIPIPPYQVSVSYSEDGYVIYSIAGEYYPEDAVTHVRAFTVFGNPRGIGIVGNFRRSLAQQLDEQALAADTYKSGATPGGVLNVPVNEISSAQADEIRDKWETTHTGRRRTAVLPMDYSFQPLQFSPQDATFIEERQLSVAECAFMCGLFPSDVDASVGGSALTYSNRQDRVIDRITDSYGPWMRRIEEAWSDLVPGGNSARFNVENLLRTDSKTRAEVAQLRIGSGTRTPDEERAVDGLPPLTSKQLDDITPPPAAPTPIPDTDLETKPVPVKA